MKITDEMVERVTNAAADRSRVFLQEWEVRAVLEAALTHPCTCREDVVCGACMSGATDPATARITPPADDVREALAESLEDFMQDWYDRWAGPGETWAVRDMAASIVEDWLPKVRPRGTVTDAEKFAGALRAIADGDGPEFVREFARDAIASSSEDPCPEWQCPDLSSEDRRENRTCPDHPCTCSGAPGGTVADAEVKWEKWSKDHGFDEFSPEWHVQRTAFLAGIEAAREAQR